jgi:hypothetical protein
MRMHVAVRSVVAALIAAFIVLYDPVRGFLYWATEDSVFGTKIGGTGGVGGIIGMAGLCPRATDAFANGYCFWHDVPAVGLTWLGLFLVGTWWGAWIALSVLFARHADTEPAASLASLHPERGFAKALAAASLFWLSSYLVYYFALTDYYKRDASSALLGVSLAAACGLMMCVTLMVLSLGRLQIAQRLLGLSAPLWPARLAFHKLVGCALLAFAALHAGGEIAYLTAVGKLAEALNPNSDYAGGDAVLLDGFITACAVAAQVGGRTARRGR